VELRVAFRGLRSWGGVTSFAGHQDGGDRNDPGAQSSR
jgi:hypothetical protein